MINQNKSEVTLVDVRTSEYFVWLRDQILFYFSCFQIINYYPNNIQNLFLLTFLFMLILLIYI